MRSINKKKSIAIIVPTLKNGGAERIASNLSKGLSEFYHIHIIVNYRSDSDYEHGGIIHNLNSKSYNNLFLKVLSMVHRVIKIRNIKKKHEIDVSISLLTASNFVNLLSRNGDKIVLTIHSLMTLNNNKSFYQKLKDSLIKKLYIKADEIVAVSEGAKLNLVKNYSLDRNEIKVIYNMFNISDIQELSRESLTQSDLEIFNYPVIVNVGRLSSVKGQWHLIKAFKAVKEEYGNVKLLLLGTGELEDELKQLVQSLNIEGDVVFKGFTDNPFKYISRSKILVSTSLKESFGNSIVEAMACGVPVVSTDCIYGPREILNPFSNIELRTDIVENAPYGILSPVCDGNFELFNKSLASSEKLLAESISQILSSPERRQYYKQVGLVRANDFTNDVILEKWIEEVIEI